MFALSLSPSPTPRSYGDRQPIEMHRHLEQNDRSETDVNSQHKVKSFFGYLNAEMLHIIYL